MALRTIVCPTPEGGLGLKDFVCQGKALRLVALVKVLGESCHKCFYMAKYFCGARLAPLRSEWSTLRDNLTPSAAQPTSFYASVLSSLQSVNIPRTFLWSPFVSARFSLSRHWRLVRDDFTENFKNDLAWLITLRAIKVRRSLRDWGYIGSSRCASCPRDETIDHCFLHCPRVKLVWFHFLPLLTSLLTSPFRPNCAFVFFYEFPTPHAKNLRLILYLIKSILHMVFGNFEIRLYFTTIEKTPEP